MANEEQVKKLKAGVDNWNEWREQNPEVKVNLIGAELQDTSLLSANLRDADLTSAELQSVNLTSANLKGANLTSAELQRTKLFSANLQGADLFAANLQGANLTNANLQGANLTSANLNGANLHKTNLQDATLTHGKLQDANMRKTNLQGTILTSANLQGANLTSAKLQGADLTRAKLRGADLFSADLQGANLFSAELQGAILTRAKLQGAILTRAKLQSADLRYVSDLRLDNTRVKDAHFSAQASDPWSKLRRTYTGPKFTFQLLALIAFAIPYIGKTVFWSFVNSGQGYSQSLLETIRKRALEQGINDREITAMGLAPEKITPLSQCLSELCEQRSVWQLLLGFDQKGLFWMLPVSLIVYNCLRGGLTFLVAPIRDEEERSGYSPAWSTDRWWQGYRPLYQAHRVVFVLGWIAFAAFLYNAYHWLSLPIYLPT